MSHDVGRGRGGQAAAVANITATPFIAAVNSDRLYFPEQSYQLAADFGPETPVNMIDSHIGHDGFLSDLHQEADEMINQLELYSQARSLVTSYAEHTLHQEERTVCC